MSASCLTCPNCGFDLESLREFSIGDLRVEHGGAEVYWQGKRMRLCPAERLIIMALVRSGGAIVKRRVLAEAAGYEGDNPTNVMAVYTSRLRKKFREIDPSFHSIQTFPRDGVRWIA